jgi:hypothetical protein
MLLCEETSDDLVKTQTGIAARSASVGRLELANLDPPHLAARLYEKRPSGMKFGVSTTWETKTR